MRHLLAVALLLPAFCVLPATAQQQPPLRPSLPKGADPNDWEAYYSYGVDNIMRAPSKSDAAFYWATRLDPTRAEPIYGRWVAFWMNDISEFPDYLDASPRVLQDPAVIASDSIRYRAAERNPLVNRALQVLLYQKSSVNLMNNAWNRAWIAYASGFYPRALEYFTAAVRAEPDSLGYRFEVALVYSQIGQYDSATAVLRELVRLMEQSDRKRLVYVYESKEMYQYALGLLEAARGHLGAAREAQEKALQENLAFAPAHAALGQLATARHDRDGAVNEYRLAVELAPNDPVFILRYADALLRADQPQDALPHLKKVVQLEPYYAEGYVTLAATYAALSDTANAITAYNDYLKRAPLNSAEKIATVRDRLAQLGKSP